MLRFQKHLHDYLQSKRTILNKTREERLVPVPVVCQKHEIRAHWLLWKCLIKVCLLEFLAFVKSKSSTPQDSHFNDSFCQKICKA